jgi:hypothetical protein
MGSRFATALRRFLDDSRELQERMALLNRPWEETYLHWSGNELHGELIPPRGACRSVTRGGWCPASSSRTDW